MSTDSYDGYILVDKPKGWTSFDVVAKVRGLVRAANRQAMAATADNTAQRQLPKRVKTGHTGTLDPLATGLLVVLVGKYTKRAPELTKLDKTYEVSMVLGQESTTGDEEGEKTAVSTEQPTNDQLQAVLAGFVGDIMQVPPAYSAMKVNGVRAYKLARQGKEVKLEARPARIDSISLTYYEYPLVRFTADVSSGTYIRSLVEVAGRALGTGAYMSDLRRTRVGDFRLDGAVQIEELPVALQRGLRTL
jgi:tRNA pseudouridine55 synthase